MKHEVVGNVQAKLARWRYGNPGRGLKIIAVAGGEGKTTTALFIGELLQEAGHSVMTMTSLGCSRNGVAVTGVAYDHSADALQRCLANAKKHGVRYVVLEISDALVATQVLPTLLITMSVVTNDSPSAQALLNQAVDYTVVPDGFNIAGLTVAPHQAISFGEDMAAEAQIVSVKEYRKGTEIDMIIDHQTKLTVATHLIGKANALNVAAAVSAVYVLAADTQSFEEGVARLETVPGNYEYLPMSDAAYDVVVDRAMTQTSIGLVLATARTLKKRRLLVIADATVGSELYDDLKRLSDRAMIIGNVPELPGLEQASDPRSAFDLMRRGAKKDDLILLLGGDVGAIGPDGNTKAHAMFEVTGE